MDKHFFKNVLTVVLGICVLIMIFSTVSLASDAALADDLVSIGSNKKLTMLIKWTALALVCLMIPTITCYVFTYFTDNKLMKIFAAALSLIVTVVCIAIFIISRNAGIEGNSSTKYATVTGYLSELLQLATASLIVCIYYVICFIKSFKNKHYETVTEIPENEED